MSIKKIIQLAIMGAFLAVGIAFFYTSAKANHVSLTQPIQPVVGQRLATPFICRDEKDVVSVNLGYVIGVEEGRAAITKFVGLGLCASNPNGWVVQVLSVDPTLYIHSDDDIGYVIEVIPWGRPDVTPAYTTVFVRSPEASGRGA